MVGRSEPASLLAVQEDRTGPAIYRHDLAISKPSGRVASSHDSRNAILTGHQPCVRSQGATIGDDGRLVRKERRPGRGRRLGDQHLARSEAREILRAAHEANRTACTARARRMADDGAWWWLTAR